MAALAGSAATADRLGADYVVVLRDDVAPNNIALLAPVLHAYTLAGGVVCNVLWCRRVDPSQGAYLEAEARLVSGKGYADLRIPHWLVLAIVGERDAPPIGFVWDDDDDR